MTMDVTIAEVLSRSVLIEWPEAVAVVRGVAERLVGSPEFSGIVPELNQVRLTPDGRVEIDGRTRSEEPVRRLAQFLQVLAAQTDAPVQLRLVISQATAPTPVFKSVREFAEALAYFERPQRAVILSRLHSRAAAAAPQSKGAAATLDELAPLPAASAQAISERKSRRGEWRVVAIVAIVALVCIPAVRYARTWSVARATRSRLAVAAGQASTTIGGAVLSGASTVTNVLGLGRLVPADQPAPPAAAPPPPAAPRPKHVASSVRAQPVPVVAFDLEPQAESLVPTPKVVMANDSPAATVASPRFEPVVVDDTTYSAGAPGVTPPVAIRPRLPRELPASMSKDNLSRIELVVGVDGIVESVKLMGKVPTIYDTMFVSVAKAWQFEPAVKNGTRVKYRKTIWIVNP